MIATGVSQGKGTEGQGPRWGGAGQGGGGHSGAPSGRVSLLSAGKVMLWRMLVTPLGATDPVSFQRFSTTLLRLTLGADIVTKKRCALGADRLLTRKSMLAEMEVPAKVPASEPR